MEHGRKYVDANITNNHPVLTGRIVLAHLKEGLDYYLRLQCMELEMELFATLVARKPSESLEKRRELAEYRQVLEHHVSRRLHQAR